jgi:hypothetical protein
VSVSLEASSLEHPNTGISSETTATRMSQWACDGVCG